VTVWALEFPEHVEIGRYFVELLEDLGFEASLESITLDELFAYAPPNADLQMVGFWLDSGIPIPSRFVAGVSTCPDYRPYPGGNQSNFCDPGIDARWLAATELLATDPVAANRAWAEVDRLTVDQSPAVAAFNPVEVALVSKRAGNVQLKPGAAGPSLADVGRVDACVRRCPVAENLGQAEPRAAIVATPSPARFPSCCGWPGT
jgi:ABC-type transport system substrate-binding protein